MQQALRRGSSLLGGTGTQEVSTVLIASTAVGPSGVRCMYSVPSTSPYPLLTS